MRLADFGLYNGINEVIGITEGEWLNTAPLGIIVEDENSISAKVRLYSSHTRENIEKGSDLWVNVCFDPIIFVISAFDDLGNEFFESLNPPVLKNATAWCKFKTKMHTEFAELNLAEGKVLKSQIRAINRGFNALIEALVHATRYVISPSDELKNRIAYYGNIIRKCGGAEEKKAFELLLKYAGLQIL